MVIVTALSDTCRVLSNTTWLLISITLFILPAWLLSGTYYYLQFTDEENRSLGCDCGSPDGAGQVTLLHTYI